MDNTPRHPQPQWPRLLGTGFIIWGLFLLHPGRGFIAFGLCLLIAANP